MKTFELRITYSIRYKPECPISLIFRDAEQLMSRLQPIAFDDPDHLRRSASVDQEFLPAPLDQHETN